MGKPVILAVDDDPEVLRAVARDLRQHYGEEYRILRAASGAEALEALRELRLTADPVALLVVDQRMPGMTGVEFLAQAIEEWPEVRRVLLTAYADTEAAIDAINTVKIDHYLMKPWSPPEDHLYPVLDDLLEAWQASHRSAGDSVRLIGHRWSPESHRARDFLARIQVPYHWYDLDSDPEAEALLTLADGDPEALPILILPDGDVLRAPTTDEITDRLGLRRDAELPLYDLVVIGAGPAGLAAAVYGASEGLKTVIIERDAAGGQATSSALIENYLGFPSGLSGSDLARRALTQARRFGAEFLLAREVQALEPREGSTTLHLNDGTSLTALSVVIATGVSYRRLEAAGCDVLTGRGVYYGATSTEARSLVGEDVYIVGGANSAGQAAMHFASYARSVTMLIRGESLAAGMSQYLVDRIEEAPNVSVCCRTTVESVDGSDRLETITLRDTLSGECRTMPASTMFIFIGAAPPTEWLGSAILRDESGFVLTGRDLLQDGRRPPQWPLDRDPFLLETSVPGVFAAGDVRYGSGKRVAAAVGEGAMAVISTWGYRASIGL